MNATHWKQRIAQETGKPWYEAFIELAKRGHSKKGAADILGIAKSTLYKHCANYPSIPWRDPYETIEWRAAQANRDSSQRLYNHLKEIHHAKTRNAAHEVLGVVGTIEVLADHFGKASARTVRRRIKEGWPLDKALTTLTKPTRRGRRA